MIKLIIALIAVIVLIISFIKEKRRKFIFRLICFSVLLFLLFINPRSFLISKPIITYDNSLSFNTDFNDFNKIDAMKEHFEPFYEIIESDTPYTYSAYHFSDLSDFNNMHFNFNDTGIDTAFYSDDTLFIRIKTFSGSPIPCSLFIERDTCFINSKDTTITIIRSGIKTISLHCNDMNPYNHNIIIDNKPIILILENNYTKHLQEFVFFLQGMYPDYDFKGAISKNDKIISSSDNYAGIILLNDVFSNDQMKPFIHINSEKNNDMIKLNKWLLDRSRFTNRIKDPFSSGKDTKLNAFKKAYLIIRRYGIWILLFFIAAITGAIIY